MIEISLGGLLLIVIISMLLGLMRILPDQEEEKISHEFN